MTTYDARREPGEVRRQRILDLIQSTGFLRPADISASFGVSQETARRDLATLDDHGSIHRVRGGAVLPGAISHDEPVRLLRQGASAEAKREIGSVVERLIPNDSTVFFDVGTTVEEAARSIRSAFHGRVITTSLQVGMILAESSDIEVIMIGGRVRPGEFTVAGAEALQELSRYRADIAVLGCGAVSAFEGVTDYNPDDIPLKRIMIESSSTSYVLADPTKLGGVAVRQVCDLSRIDAVVTSSDAAPEVADDFGSRGARLVAGLADLDG